MFFPEKISNIKPTDRVLEVGPGSSPHPRSDILLEKYFNNEKDWTDQRGCTQELKSNKEIVFYHGGKFPFEDNEFDYVICSHVIEHVPDVEFFLSELFRVAPKGYIEYPTIYYEYLYNFNVHLNFIKFKNGKLFYLDKNNTGFNAFLPVQRLFYRYLEMGYSGIVEDLKPFMFEGFEWNCKFEAKRANAIEDMVFDNFEIPKAEPQANSNLLSRWAKRIKA